MGKKCSYLAQNVVIIKSEQWRRREAVIFIEIRLALEQKMRSHRIRSEGADRELAYERKREEESERN